MTSKVKKNKRKRDIDSDIETMFETIDQYLPRNYTDKVILKLKEDHPDLTAGAVKQTKYAKSGNISIIRAMFDVATETRELLTK